MEWIIERINLDPDAFSCAIIIAILLVFMVVTVAIWAVWRVAYIKLWRWNRRKKSPPVGQNQTRGETDSSGMVALTYCLARLLRDDFSQRWAREIATRLVRSIIAKLVKDDKKFLKANGNYKVKEGSEHETD